MQKLCPNKRWEMQEQVCLPVSHHRLVL